MRKKYVIDCCTFIHDSGGIVALHKLCHDLNGLGEEAFITSPITHNKLNAPFVSDRKFKKDELVVVYPEVNLGNPHNAKHVVRWVLNTPGKCGGVGASNFYSTKKDTDLIFKYSEYFHIEDESESKGLLTTTFIDSNYFYKSEEKRSGSAFFVKKGGLHNKIHPDDSIDLSKYGNDWKSMGDVFRKVEYLYCYDNACFWVVVAALCGCIPIVIPDSDMSAEEWYSKFPHKRCGVAYGLDQTEHAKNTLHLAEDNFKEFSEKQLDTVRNFVNICNSL